MRTHRDLKNENTIYLTAKNVFVDRNVEKPFDENLKSRIGREKPTRFVEKDVENVDKHLYKSGDFLLANLLKTRGKIYDVNFIYHKSNLRRNVYEN